MEIEALRQKFPEGTKVILKSGGPQMVTEIVRDDGIISCIWFNDSNVVCRDGFHHDALIVVP